MTIQRILEKTGLTMDELKEYSKLKFTIFGTGLFKSLFVIVDENSPEVRRYNELATKVMKLQALIWFQTGGPHPLLNGVIQ